MKLFLAAALFVSVALPAASLSAQQPASQSRPQLPYLGPRVGPLVSQTAEKNQAHINMLPGDYNPKLQTPGWTEHLTLPIVDANGDPVLDANGNPTLYTYYSNSGELLARILAMLTGYSG